MKIIILLAAILIAGCAGIGYVATSDPDQKIQQAYSLIEQDRALLAEDIIRQAMDIYKTDNNKLGMAEAYHTYGNLYVSNSYHGTWAATFKKYGTYDGTYMKAINNYQQSEVLFEELGSDIGVVKSLVGIANSYSLRGETESACTYYKKASQRYKDAKAAGKITNEPVIVAKRLKDMNMGQIIDLYIEHYKCST